MYVTYLDLIQIGTPIVVLANLIYQIYDGKKQPLLLPIMTATYEVITLLFEGQSRFNGFPFSMFNIASCKVQEPKHPKSKENALAAHCFQTPKK